MTDKRTGALQWLRRYRTIGGVLASFMLAFALTVQSGIVCPDGTHGIGGPSVDHALGGAMHHHGGMPTHHPNAPGSAAVRASQAPCDAPLDAGRVPLCCWALASCASPAAPAARTAAGLDVLDQANVLAASLIMPRPLAFAPDTPPPRA